MLLTYVVYIKKCLGPRGDGLVVYGNGRFARLATSLLIEQLGERRFTWGALSKDSNETIRSKYLSALKKADLGNMSALLKFARS